MISSTSIVTITYEGDARLAVLQILSVDRLFRHADIDEYVIVLNGADNATLRSFVIDEALSKISPELAAKVRFLDAADVIGQPDAHGWRAQQLIKLVVARHITSDYYLLLDGKNHFVRRSSLDEFFEGGRPLNTLGKVTPNWLKFIQASMKAFGLDPSAEMPESTFPTITPYLMIRDEVVAAIEKLEERFDMPLLKSFETKMSEATEFFLYWAHLYSTGKMDLYSMGEARVATLYTVWPQDHGAVMRIIGEAGERVPVFGLHRLRLPQLSPEQRNAITSLWRRELLSGDERSEWFLTAT